MASSSSNGSLLPFEILESILCRVPAESLNRFKLTCKRWLALFKEKVFIYNHLDLVLDQEHFILIGHSVQLINTTTSALTTFPLPDALQFTANNNGPCGFFYDVIHCDGLLLCIYQYPYKLALWNPCSNQLRWIESRFIYQRYDFYGIGYDNVSRDNYKILRYHHEDRDSCVSCEVYESRSNSWRSLDVSLDWNIHQSCSGVSVNGNMYWVAHSLPRRATSDEIALFIQRFDFSTEKFKLVCSIPFVDNMYDTVALSGYKKEDKLSLLHQGRFKGFVNRQAADIEIWVTNNVKDRVVSWTRLFVVSRPDLPELCIYSWPPAYPVHFIDENNRINVICGEEFLDDRINHIFVNVYVIGNDGLKKQEIRRYAADQGWSIKSGYPYLPSLVPVT